MKITTELPIFMEHGQTAHPIMQHSPSTPRPPPGGTAPGLWDVETSTLLDSRLNSPGLAQGLTHCRCTVDLERTSE